MQATSVSPRPRPPRGGKEILTCRSRSAGWGFASPILDSRPKPERRPARCLARLPQPAEFQIPRVETRFSRFRSCFSVLRRLRSAFRTLPSITVIASHGILICPQHFAPQPRARTQHRRQARASGNPSAGEPAAHPAARRPLAVARPLERRPTGSRAADTFSPPNWGHDGRGEQDPRPVVSTFRGCASKP